jgi:hypothetical protein
MENEANAPWTKVSDLSYFRQVLGNMSDLGFGIRNSTTALVRFGMTGIGHAPNYQIEGVDGSTHCFRGMGHAPAREVESEPIPRNVQLRRYSGHAFACRRACSLMTSTASDAPPGIFSPEWFETDELGIAMRRALDQHDGDIVRAADAGEPPVVVLAPALDDLISESIYWRWLEKTVEKRLTPGFEVMGKKPLKLTSLPRGRYYRRVVT